MPKLRQVALIAFDGFQILDITGPASVFSAANDALGKPYYQVVTVSAKGGLVTSHSGISIQSQSYKSSKLVSIDTLLIAGGSADGLEALTRNEPFMKWITQAAQMARRYGSVCTGAFVLGHLGLLKKKKVTTHWGSCQKLATLYPETEVDANALFINQGKLWTSAGVTTGIDMGLEMVAQAHGVEIANVIAKRLVLYARRPGYQSQFSPLLKAQENAVPQFLKLVEWLGKRLDQNIDIPRMAEQAAMSERTFYRKFTQCFGETPRDYVEKLRLDNVRILLSSKASLKQIASLNGYPTAAQLTKAFAHRFGVSPAFFRKLHCQEAHD
ncbi:GlxA family transcriptional regulator [Polynucleobacter asymbioticus]|jgi:transcriptional regulator GlxA family with amidase domain|uniref:AraC family transcriptional regulator n=1 Tax=Polynucleobacter asymbioticus TaxID=576611 RepID=A0AAC9NHU8_9BURK|nr:AraC family transcriptional regulator [Polynucleobacter asymbioticus]APB97877.1 AraC family transcriptional regulator [Polynucleobacter asymbioticus]APC00162.1 AraC family transcriptional regulator [Polynucleobacter asymbioticus]